jgi:transcriptional regulator
VFVPDIYRPPDDGWIAELVRSFPLATLVTAGPDRPFVTHLPTVLERDLTGTSTPEPGLGGTILGHLNRANPHWSALRPGTAAVLVFQGPGGYVTPTIYPTAPAAPTWNFAAVHVHGTLRPIDSPARTMRVVRQTARIFEERFGAGWDQGPSLGYFGQLLPGVAAFEVAIESVDGMFKLSQEKEPEVRRRVADAFAHSERGLHRELAALMNRLDQPAAVSGRADGPR